MNLPTDRQFLCATVGLPASGKSTWATDYVRAHPNVVRINRDSLRAMQDPTKWSGKFEDMIRHQRDILISQALRQGKSVICDDTNIKPKTLDSLKVLAHSTRAEFLTNDEFLKVSVEECIKRDIQRKEGRCGKDVIERMYYDYWSTQEKPANEGVPAIMCDLDGTLAVIPPGANPYDRDFMADGVDQAVFNILCKFAYTGYAIVIVSGRSGKFRAVTRQWLTKNEMPLATLFMREASDLRKDTVIKKEMFMNHVQGNYKIDFVLDDRPSVVRMWRAELGLTVLQVGPNIEF